MSSNVIAIVIYPGFTVLDAMGPYEVLSRLGRATKTDWRAMFVAQTLDPVRSEQGLEVKPDGTFAGVSAPAVLLVAGGPGQFDQMENKTLLGYLKRAAGTARITSSVCTGSLLLARAGLLDGRRATSHWLAMDALKDLGAVPESERVVVDGSIMTGAGVSAGIDLALLIAAELAGEDVAKGIQLGIEYDPKPPFNAGSPDTAPAPIVEAMRGWARKFL